MRASFLPVAGSFLLVPSHSCQVKMEGLLQDLACAETANGRPTLAHQVDTAIPFRIRGNFWLFAALVGLWARSGSLPGTRGPVGPHFIFPFRLCSSCPCPIPHPCDSNLSRLGNTSTRRQEEARLSESHRLSAQSSGRSGHFIVCLCSTSRLLQCTKSGSQNLILNAMPYTVPRYTCTDY
jgi:hypothetical protein